MVYIQKSFNILRLNSENMNRVAERTDIKLSREGERYYATSVLTGRAEFVTTSIVKLITKLADYQARKGVTLQLWYVQSDFDYFDRIQLGLAKPHGEIAASEMPASEVRRVAAELGVDPSAFGGVIFLEDEDDSLSCVADPSEEDELECEDGPEEINENPDYDSELYI